MNIVTNDAIIGTDGGTYLVNIQVVISNALGASFIRNWGAYCEDNLGTPQFCDVSSDRTEAGEDLSEGVSQVVRFPPSVASRTLAVYFNLRAAIAPGGVLSTVNVYCSMYKLRD